MSVTGKRTTKEQAPEVLDAVTLAALDEGLRMAASDPRRWSPDQVREDARAMAKEWRKKITQKVA
jgi:hypothetical protein